MPIERLVLNVENKRFSSERELVEHKLGRPLDPSNNPADEESIVAILCDSSLDVDLERGVAVGHPSKDFSALHDDWVTRGQAEPLWIRPDGTVRNGNRRLAMLKRRRLEGADTHWVQAIILDGDDVDESELFRMEQREQLTENFKKRYQDVNALLALRDAAELEGVDWDDPDSMAQAATTLQHYAGRDDPAYASKQLYAVRALDKYLDYINAPGRYSLATKQVEVFREVGLCMSSFEDEPDQQFELVQAAFALCAGRLQVRRDSYIAEVLLHRPGPIRPDDGHHHPGRGSVRVGPGDRRARGRIPRAERRDRRRGRRGRRGRHCRRYRSG